MSELEKKKQAALSMAVELAKLLDGMEKDVAGFNPQIYHAVTLAADKATQTVGILTALPEL